MYLRSDHLNKSINPRSLPQPTGFSVLPTAPKQTTQSQWADGPNRRFSKEDTQVANRRVKVLNVTSHQGSAD